MGREEKTYVVKMPSYPFIQAYTFIRDLRVCVSNDLAEVIASLITNIKSRNEWRTVQFIMICMAPWYPY